MRDGLEELFNELEPGKAQTSEGWLDGEALVATIEEWIEHEGVVDQLVEHIWDKLEHTGGTQIAGYVYPEDVEWIVKEAMKELTA